jgi:citrate lyase subunit beta/citryl-CoA lyase
MVETPQAILQMATIAASGGRLGGLVMGLNDLAKETGARETPGRPAFQTAMSLAVMAARAHDLVAFDGVHNEIDDLEALASVCREGAVLGFDGKSLIHPSHLTICNAAFSPPADEVAWARAVIATFADPANAGKGALRVAGRLAERLHCVQAERLISVAAAIAAMEGAIVAP